MADADLDEDFGDLGQVIIKDMQKKEKDRAQQSKKAEAQFKRYARKSDKNLQGLGRIGRPKKQETQVDEEESEKKRITFFRHRKTKDERKKLEEQLKKRPVWDRELIDDLSLKMNMAPIQIYKWYYDKYNYQSKR